MIFGFCSLGDFIKEDLVRDDKEEKKLKALKRRRKRKKRRVALEEAEIIRASEEAIGASRTASSASACCHRGRSLVISPVAGPGSRPRSRTTQGATTASGSDTMPGTALSPSWGARSNG